jgi:hypothetical protein
MERYDRRLVYCCLAASVIALVLSLAALRTRGGPCVGHVLQPSNSPGADHGLTPYELRVSRSLLYGHALAEQIRESGEFWSLAPLENPEDRNKKPVPTYVLARKLASLGDDAKWGVFFLANDESRWREGRQGARGVIKKLRFPSTPLWELTPREAKPVADFPWMFRAAQMLAFAEPSWSSYASGFDSLCAELAKPYLSEWHAGKILRMRQEEGGVWSEDVRRVLKIVELAHLSGNDLRHSKGVLAKLQVALQYDFHREAERDKDWVTEADIELGIVDFRMDAARIAGVVRCIPALPEMEKLLDDKRFGELQKGPWMRTLPKGYVCPSQGIAGDMRDLPDGERDPRVCEVAAWAIQRILDKDIGFRTCAESRKDMPDIIKRAREAIKEFNARQP